jgi:hypothetical protein
MPRDGAWWTVKWYLPTSMPAGRMNVSDTFSGNNRGRFANVNEYSKISPGRTSSSNSNRVIHPSIVHPSNPDSRCKNCSRSRFACSFSNAPRRTAYLYFEPARRPHLALTGKNGRRLCQTRAGAFAQPGECSVHGAQWRRCVRYVLRNSSHAGGCNAPSANFSEQPKALAGAVPSAC